jgi:hypothetical protein
MIVVQALLMLGVRAADIRSFPLDERTVYTVRLNAAEPTTCVFPAPIKALVGANVSTRADEQPGILLAHEAGSDYFSLRLFKEGASGALNVILRGKVYALAFVPATDPDRAVVFLDPKPEAPTAAKPDEPTLRRVVERAKQDARLRAGGIASTLPSAAPRSVTRYRDFTATIEAIVRFDAEDALVFRVRLANDSDRVIAYAPEALAVRLGREIFPVVWTEASGAIPARGTAVVHLVIAGAPEGGRANLSVHEDFSVIVPQS